MASRFRKWFNLGIKQKLALTFLSLSLIPTLMIGFLTYQAAEEVLTKKTLDTLSSVAAENEARIQLIGEQYQERLTLIPLGTSLPSSLQEFSASSSEVAQADLTTLMAGVKQSLPDVIDARVVTPSGEVAAATDQAVVGQNIATEEYFQRASTDFVPLRVVSEGGSPVLRVAGPVRQGAEPIGVLVLTLKLERINSVVSEVTGLGETGDPVIVQREPSGEAIYITPLRFNQGAVLKVRAPKEETWPANQALNRNENTFTDLRDYRKQEVFAATRYIESLDWGLVVKIDKAEAYQSIAQLRNILVGFTLVLSILVALLTLEITRSITRPLFRLSEVTEKISEGKFTRRADARSDDEIGLLARSINNMAARLQASHRKFEQQVSERTESLTDAQRLAQMGNWRWSNQTQEFEWSDEMYRIYGFRGSKRATVETIRSRIHKDDRSGVQKTFQLALQLGKSYTQEYRVVRPSGEVRTVQEKAEVIRDADGKVSQIRAIVLDITERKKAEQQAIQLAAIVESSSDAIYSRDLHGKIISWNTGARQMYGYTDREAVGKPISFLLPTDRNEELADIITKVREGHAVQKHETERLTKDGEIINVSLTASPIRDSSGNVTAVSIIARDITEQYELQKRQRDFVSIASHELRTPITALMGYLSLVTGDQVATAQSQQFLDRAGSAASRLSGLVEDLLSVARLEEERMSFTITPVYPPLAIEEVLTAIKPKAVEKNISFRLDSKLKASDRMAVDRTKFEQILVNVIDNAVKYTPEHGSVRIVAQASAKRITVVIKDTGIGIHRDNLEKIYDRFYREYTELSVQAGGTGLGLFITKELVERQDGTMKLESVQGQSTTVTISFPRYITRSPGKK